MEKKNIQNILKAYFENDTLGLPSAQFYKKLDRHLFNYNNVNSRLKQNELKVYYNICELFNTTHRNDLYRRLCSVLLWNLSTASTIINEENNVYNNCELLNYWIYSRLSWIYKRMSGPITDKFGKLQLLWNSLVETPIYSSFYNKCSPKFKILYQRNWMQRKELYDYCIDYETILSISKNYKDKRNIIIEYFNRKTNLYNEYNKYCNEQQYNNNCPEFFSKCKESSPSNALAQINHYIEAEKGIPENSAVKSKDTFSGHKSTERENSVEVQSDAIDAKESDGHFISFDVLAPADDSLLTLYGIDEFADLFINRGGSSIIKILGKAFLGLILFTLLSSILYKFTPIGIRLRKIFGQKKNIISDVYRSKNMLFDYSSEPCNPKYMNREDHCVGYHSE
ncbi:variable surface protein [Plasmodium gonderi]|uniref:Variable surface protein n=1 Tax=Plasmodium gonderi TaxID=77519 RepID=A0A1Y1JNA3_PLAGO|nr:variable surface protein [Plasmodium gonderi]GAW83951.1 variable surface protein [Plasmodium gonderi]